MLKRPIGVIEALYAHFGFDFNEELRGHMQRYLAARPRDKHGRHDYRAEDFGLDPVRDREHFARYCETYLAD